MSRYATNNQMRVGKLTILDGMTDRQAARILKKSPAATKQARYRLRRRAANVASLAWARA